MGCYICDECGCDITEDQESNLLNAIKTGSEFSFTCEECGCDIMECWSENDD